MGCIILTVDKSVAYEADIQKMVLDNQTLFGTLGASNVIMEKKLPGRKVIADMLIFSSNKGIIGVEIKTAHDTTQRLNKQLDAYKKLCNQVWVVIADEQYDKVLAVLKRYNHDAVGIISYGQIGDKLYPGIMRRPHLPKEFDPKEAYRMLWKKELIVVANSLSENGMIIADIQESLHSQFELGTTNWDISRSREAKANAKGKRVKQVRLMDMRAGTNTSGSIATNQMNKEQIIRVIFKRISTLGAHQLIVDMFVNETKAPDKVLHYYHFKNIDKKVRYEIDAHT